MSTRKLTIELVPQTSWFNNLRNAMGPAWDGIRKKAYRDAGYRCAVCGVQDRLHCHERWKYDDQKHVQTLEGFIALCEWCHHCKHLGFANVLASRGQLDLERVISHYMRVNGCTRAEFDRDAEAAFDLWQRRSGYKWHVDLGPWAPLVEAGQRDIRHWGR